MQINQWQQLGKVVLVGMDTNENVDDPKSQIVRVFSGMDIINLNHHRFPAHQKPATHQCGSAQIDILVGSPLLVTSLSHSWMLPFGTPPLIKGDHCLLGADFQPDVLFRS